MAKDQIQYVTAPKVDENRKKYCRYPYLKEPDKVPIYL
jgi:hypothetical protein